MRTATEIMAEHSEEQSFYISRRRREKLMISVLQRFVSGYDWMTDADIIVTFGVAEAELVSDARMALGLNPVTGKSDAAIKLADDMLDAAREIESSK